MTATATEAVRAWVASMPYDVVSTTVGVVAVLILAVLLLRRDAMRILGGPDRVAGNAVFDIALIPFLLVFSSVVTARLAELIV